MSTAAIATPTITKLPVFQIQSARNPDKRRSAERIPALDGLRGVAILLVLLRHSVAGTDTTSHFWSAMLVPLRLTWSGVDLFFVLSGFLIGGILLDARGSPSYFKTFYVRRAFRIFPVYFVFLTLYLGRHLTIALISSIGSASQLPVPWYSFFTFTQNFWMVAFGWFGPMAIAPTWSLAVEEQFYLAVPFLIRRTSAKALCPLLISIIVMAPLLRSLLPHIFRHGDFACYVLMPSRADALCMGVLAAFVVRHDRSREWISSNRRMIFGTVLGASAGIVWLTYFGQNQYTPPITTWGFSCLGTFYTGVLLCVYCALSPTLIELLSTVVLRKLGQLAYCSYLAHCVLIEACRSFIRSHTALSSAQVWAGGGITGVALALIVASISWKYLEEPLIRRGHGFAY